MQDLRFEFHTKLELSGPVTDHDFILRCVPRICSSQYLKSYNLAVEPMEGQGSYSRDAFGNTVFYGHVSEAHQVFQYSIHGRIVLDGSQPDRTVPMACYSYSSPLAVASDEMKEFLQELDLAGGAEEKIRQLGSSIHEHFQYLPGSTNVATTAAQAFGQGQGVCQDYAHVFVSLARLAGLPARYVCGLPRGEGATHAWGEVWADGCWHGYDPTRNQPVDEGYIVLAVGRDYLDCPVERGVFRGAADQLQTVFMKVQDQ